MLIKHELANRLAAAVERAQRLNLLPAASLPDVALERPQQSEHGDLASGLPLRLARAARMAPLEIAEKLIPLIECDDVVQHVWAAPPGFINFALKESWLTNQVESIRQAGDTYGNISVGEGQKVQLEFVSVNPTGPVHVGHARGAILGSVLATVLSAAGYEVTREYYVNDTGGQMEAFYRSLYVRHIQAMGRNAEMPANGYVGDYMTKMGQETASEFGDRFLQMPEEQAVTNLGAIGLERMLAKIRSDLEAVGVQFDVWFSESSLYTGGQYRKSMDILSERGYLVQREGATWFASTILGEDKDNVLIRMSGQPTYFASDIAYHYNKFVERKFHRVIDVWGADHQGHVSRMKAAVEALGESPDMLHIIIAQLVALKRGQEVVRASKRTGELITLSELVDEVGPDACRFFFLSKAPETQMEFDMEVAKHESSDNPVYYVQYGYARIAGILQTARERGIDWANGDASLLTHPSELALIRKMVLLPELVEVISHTLMPHHLPHYATELATAFHVFYQQCRVVSSKSADEAVTKARLKLAEAARTVLKRVLNLMGMDAPERM
jgi:arginyl-tRNA synthetase